MTTLIDGNNLLHRVLYGEGTLTGAHSIRQYYNKLSIDDHDLTVMVWDGYNSNERRKKLYPEYKANRPPRTEDIYAIFDMFQELLCHTAVMQIKVPEWEADDVIYTLAKFFSSSGDNVVINTNDADYLQMADLPNVTLPGIKPWAWPSDLICTYKALVGDPADNIPGMPRFGEGAWGHTRTYHETMREALYTDNWDLWKTIPFPKLNQAACGDKGNFDQCVTFFNLVSMYDVPLEDITSNSVVGTRNPAAAEALLSKFYL